jgi:hypothetical protein
VKIFAILASVKYPEIVRLSSLPEAEEKFPAVKLKKSILS